MTRQHVPTQTNSYNSQRSRLLYTQKIEKKWSTSTCIDVSCFLWERGSVSIGGILNQVIYKAVVVVGFFLGGGEGERGDCLTAKIFKAARIC